MSLNNRFFSISWLNVCIFVTTVSSSQQPLCSKCDQCFSGSLTDDNSDFIGHYTFPTTPIKSLECTSEDAIKRLENAVPVVLKNCHFGKVTRGWNIEYLKENLLSPNMTVYVSPTRRFLFYNSQKEGRNYSWSPPHNHTLMNFTQFLDIMDQLDEAGNGSKAYLQSSLEKDLLNSDMQDDVFMFNTLWLQQLKERLGWGRQDLNLFLVGMAGVVTPAHYDIMENLFLQIHGKKRCILFSPETYKYLYPYPIHHPHDRQTQVNFDFPDFEKFPKFRNITGVDAVLEPGDVLYIPNYWWHYIESEKYSETISMNFWYLPKGDLDEEFPDDGTMEAREDAKRGDTGDENKVVGEHETKETTTEAEKRTAKKSSLSEVTKELEIKETLTQFNGTKNIPLSAGELIGLTREIEEMVGNALGDVTKVGEFLQEMVEGRYDFV